MNERNNKTLESISKFLLPLLVLVVPLLCWLRLSSGQSRLARTEIPFKGNATGGKLVIGYIPDPHSVHTSIVSIDTSAGESAESIVNRLAAAITSSDAIFSKMSKNPKAAETMKKEMAKGNTLSIRGMLDDYILAGTETGLGIPKPPLSLSGSYNKERRTIDLRWVNPSGDSQYDSLRILWRYRNIKNTLGDSLGGSKFIWDTSKNFTIELPKEVNEVDVDIWIRGLRHEMPIEEMRAKDIPLSRNVVPSNATAIHITNDGHSQEETYGIPFFAGVSPNWTAWSTAAKTNEDAFEQGEKYAGVRRYEPIKALLTNPYYQIIKAPPLGTKHGIYRKFLGLTPGHTYRLIASLSTLEMDKVQGEWSFCLHAAPSGIGKKEILTTHMAGKSILPYYTDDTPNGLRFACGPDRTTRGTFEIFVTGHSKVKDDKTSSNITLPPDANEITVWLSFSCDDPAGKVAVSGLMLEDITEGDKVLPAEALIRHEASEEQQLLRTEQEALRRISSDQRPKEQN